MNFYNYCLKINNKLYINYLNNLQNHIYILLKNFIITNVDKNKYMNIIYEILRDINKEYEIMFSNNQRKEFNFKNYIKDIIDTSNNDILYTYIVNYLKIDNNINLINLIYPLNKLKKKIIDIYLNIGINNIKEFINIYTNNNYIIKESDLNLLNFYNDIFISYNIEILNNNKLLLEDINIINNNSIFNSKRIFVKKSYDINKQNYPIKNNNFILIVQLNKKNSIKFYGYIKTNDYLLLTINSYNLYNKISDKLIQKKNFIYNLLKPNELYKKKILKYLELWEIITMDNKELIKYINNNYNKYIEISKKSFNLLTKDFINNSIKNINYCYTIIKLLLLGNDENINNAGILYSLLYEKNNTNNIADIIYYNLIFLHQVKLKKVTYDIKSELDKLNELSYDTNDYKKQLALNQTIPKYVKILTMEKINEMKLYNNDYYKQLTYVKYILEFPWDCENDIFNLLSNDNKLSQDYLTDVKKKLFNITYGHNIVKDKLLLQVAQWISNPNSKGNAISLCGPPGVGKTLLAKSLSKSLDIPFVHITLGGQNDGDILHGHSYTYSSAQPGLILKKINEAGSNRCILYFDELDKTSYKNGNNEIMNILIHLTDYNMNKTFQDRFFQGIDFPLDKVIIITSYNDSSKIDPILLDRFIEINIKSYNIYDKINIIEHYILNEIKNMINLKSNIIFYKDDMIKLINNFTNESGVRNIKKILEELFLKININNILSNNIDNDIHLTYNYITNLLPDLIINKFDTINEFDEIGIINGLYATTNGLGGIIKIQIKKNINSDKNIITGNVGNSMKESIDVAYTLCCDYIEKNKTKYNITNLKDYLNDNFKSYHIHCGDISTNKDGPSATALICICFISVILNKKINRKISCTSEADLQGNLMKIGSLEYKLFGAKKCGIEKVYISSDNKLDLIQITDNYSDLFDKSFECIILKNIFELIDLIFVD